MDSEAPRPQYFTLVADHFPFLSSINFPQIDRVTKHLVRLNNISWIGRDISSSHRYGMGQLKVEVMENQTTGSLRTLR